MFSQLCRARPRYLWDKISSRSPVTRDDYGIGENIGRANNSESNREEKRCQLVHCNFCDFRVCCEVANRSPEELATSIDLKPTENPAYGLFVKNWFEIDKEQWGDDGLSFENDVSKSPDYLEKSDSLSENAPSSTLTLSPPSQNNPSPKVIKMNHLKKIRGSAEVNGPKIDVICEKNQKLHDSKHNGVSWSVLKHRQTTAEITENCDIKIPNVKEAIAKDRIPQNTKPKRNKEKPLPVSKPISKTDERKNELRQLSSQNLMADLSRQKPVDRNSRNVFQNVAQNEDNSNKPNKGPIDPLSEITQIKTEESIQEWLARISESTENLCREKSSHGSAWDLRSDEEKEFRSRSQKGKTEAESSTPNIEVVKQAIEKHTKQEHRNFEQLYPEILQEEEIDTASVLCNASKINPANIPMVVMQCSRLHSQINSKPPFQQTSLPMGTLVTALYQESEWLYVQTPHGVEGFISAANCAPIGTVNEPDAMSKRPWEPCDFPIQITRHKKEQFACQQSAYIQTRLPANGNKQSIPYLNTVKIKTNFYNDRYFSNTFKAKDSIKIAKTVTDILRSSPETKVSH